MCSGARAPAACDASFVRWLLHHLVILRAVASSVFFLGNLSYCLASLLLACLALQAGARAGQDTVRRERVETCSSICSPWDGLTILHHLEHRSQLPPVTCHMSPVTYHLSLTSHLPPVTSRGGAWTNLITLVLLLWEVSVGVPLPPALCLTVPLLLLCSLQVLILLGLRVELWTHVSDLPRRC